MSPRKSPINLILGAANIGDSLADPTARYDAADDVEAYFRTFAARGYNQIDTARIYPPQAPGTSEARIGDISAGDKFRLDTKIWADQPGSHTKGKVLEAMDMSLEALKVRRVNIEYLHVPDRTTPFEESCEAMHQAHQNGKLKHWGLSNYTAEEVRTIVDVCKDRGFIKPSVYQGHYNLLARGGEKDLFPLLRKHGIAFYAYSPAAGGLFAGNHKTVKQGGRYDTSPAIMDAVENALKTVIRYGITGHDAALRWTAYQSAIRREHGDSIIIAASSVAELESDIDSVEAGPLPENVVAALEAIYTEIGDLVPYHQ